MADTVEFEMMPWIRTLPEDKRAFPQMMYLQQRKDPSTALGLSLLFFVGFAGVGRIYVGDVGYGIAMFLLSWATCGIWTIVDLFLISGATERTNREVLARIRMTTAD